MITNKQLNNMDFKDLLNLALELLLKNNKQLSLKELKNEYYDYFEPDYIKEVKTKKEFLYNIMVEEENYKREYSEEELRDFIKAVRGVK